MKKLFLFAVLLAGCAALAQVGAPPTVLQIQNSSFETPGRVQAQVQCGARSYPVPGWVNTIVPDSGGFAGILQPNNPNPCLIPVPPDGQGIAWLGNATISQDLGVKASDLQAVSFNGLYVMKFYVTNYFHNYPGYYEAKVSLGAQELCSTDGWGTKDFVQVTLICPAPGYVVYDNWPYPVVPAVHANTADHLSISLTAKGWELLFDDVSLTFAPQ